VSRARHRAGFSILSALFLVVVLGALGSLMLRINSIGRQSSNFTLMGARTYHAARSGLEWGIHRALADGACPAPSSFPLDEGGLAGLQVVVTCTRSVHTEAALDSSVYQLLSIAEFGSFGDRDYMRRQLQASFTDAP